VSEGRLANHLTLSLEMVYKIYYRQILWGVLAGPQGYTWLLSHLPQSATFFLMTTVMSLLLLVYALWKSPPQLQAFIFFAALIFASSLLSPTVYADGQRSVYQVMFDTSGLRYWLIPMVGLLVMWLWSVKKNNPFYVRGLGFYFLLILTFFQLKHLVNYQIVRYPAFVDYHWAEQATEFEMLTPGESKMFLINPPGWQMTLHKK
jgi:hypothetical protein